MNNHTSTSTLPEENAPNGRLLQIYNNKRQNMKEADKSRLPTLKKSISRSILNSGSNSLSPTRPTFKTTTAQAQQQQQPAERQLTIETAVFPPILDENMPTKRSTSTPAAIHSNDSRIIVPSGSESTTATSRSNSTNNNKRQQKKKASNSNVASSFVNPTDIFAQNLSDAVMDADDSDDLECYVYRDKPHTNQNGVGTNNTLPPNSYTIAPPWSNNYYEDYNNIYDRHYSSTGTESNTDGYESFAGGGYNNKEKYYSPRRPVLRSTVSEIPHHHSSMRSGKKFSSGRPLHYHYNPSEDEEFTPLVRSRPPRRRKGTSSYHGSNSGKNNHARRTCFRFFCVITGCLFTLCLLWILIVIYASPLTDVEVVGISNVLGTQKELIFNLQVRARNSNWWTIRMTNTAFSVFASSHYVPTSLLLMSSYSSSTDNSTFPNITTIEQYQKTNLQTLGADPAEFLGTITHLEDPLIYQSGGLFKSVTSTATSQIQIKNPGSTKDDHSGNERWSLLIRYPYELTVRGVLKYQILPYLPTLTQLHSVRVCKMSRIDPATGKISDSVPPEKSICDDPSPVEGSSSG